MERTKITFAFGSLLLVIGLLSIVLWLTISANSAQPMDELRRAYLSHFPAFVQAANLSDLQKVQWLTGATALVLAASAALFAWADIHNSSMWGRAAKSGAVVSGLLACWQAFSLL